MYCKTHSLGGMVNVKAQRCEKDGCNVIPHYGYEHGGVRFCASHYKVGMIAKHKRCEEEGCYKYPTYGKRFTKKATHCTHHKEEKAVLLRGTCCRMYCNQTGNLTIDGSDKKWCGRHCPPYAYKAYAPKCCECHREATYGVQGGDKVVCYRHKSNDHVLLKKSYYKKKNKKDDDAVDENKRASKKRKKQ